MFQKQYGFGKSQSLDIIQNRSLRVLLAGETSEMDAGWAVVLAAVVSAVGGILVTLLQKFRKENSRDHEVVTGILRMVYRAQQRTEDKIDKVDERLSSHIESHHSN